MKQAVGKGAVRQKPERHTGCTRLLVLDPFLVSDLFSACQRGALATTLVVLRGGQPRFREIDVAEI